MLFILKYQWRFFFTDIIKLIQKIVIKNFHRDKKHKIMTNFINIAKIFENIDNKNIIKIFHEILK